MVRLFLNFFLFSKEFDHDILLPICYYVVKKLRNSIQTKLVFRNFPNELVLRKEYGFTNKLVIDVCENIDIRNSDKKDVWELQQHSADLTSHTGGGCWHIILVTHFSTSGGNYGKWHGRPIENSALSWKLTHAHQKMEKQDRGVQQPSANYCMAKNLPGKKATMTKWKTFILFDKKN